MRVDAEIVVKIKYLDVKLHCGFRNHIGISFQRFSRDALGRMNRGEQIIHFMTQQTTGRRHENNGLAAIGFAEVVHQIIHTAAEGCGRRVTNLTKRSISVNIVIDTAVNDDHIGIRVHIVRTTAEAKVVPRFCTRECLMCQTAAVDTVIVHLCKPKHFCDTVIITAIRNIGNADTEGDAVTQKINYKSFHIHEKTS